MSENSAFWEDDLVGDAASITGWEAPYLSSEKVDVLSLLVGSDNTDGYVLPEYLSELRVHQHPDYGLVVLVDAGTAFVKGRLYENTATATLTITANASGNPRIDRVILRTDFAAQTIRLAILQGTPGATPALPTLTQDANTWEVSLAYIWMHDGSVDVGDYYIYDERQFLVSFKAINNSFGGFNKLTNSEFMAMSNYDITSDLPANWRPSSFGNTTESDTRPTQMSRGRSVKLNGQLRQAFNVKPNTTYSIRALFKIEPGDYCYISVFTDSYGGGSETGRFTKVFYETGTWLDRHFYVKTDHDATTMHFSFQSEFGEPLYCGQALIIEGYYPGDFREFSEFLFPNVSYFGQSLDNYSTETVVWDMETCNPDFGGYILDGTKSILLQTLGITPIDPSVTGVKFRASGGTDIIGSLTPYNVYGAIADSQIEIPLIDRKFEADYLAIGVDDLPVEMWIVGMKT